jgi:hypothetical protein
MQNYQIVHLPPPGLRPPTCITKNLFGDRIADGKALAAFFNAGIERKDTDPDDI